MNTEFVRRRSEAAELDRFTVSAKWKLMPSNSKLMITLPKNDAKLVEFVKDWDNEDNPRAAMGV